jgi:drug/metabolite transporter (DMT)-like permease
MISGSGILLVATLEPGGEIAWSLPFLGLLLFLALAGTALLTLVWYWLLRHGGLGRLSLFFYEWRRSAGS